MVEFDGVAKSNEAPFSVLPTSPGLESRIGAGIQKKQTLLVPGWSPSLT
jgi:hypothetical protein